MNLTDLFVSHKRVKPITFNPSSVSHTTPDIYSNRQRAHEATTPTAEEETTKTEEEDISTWRVPGAVNWRYTNRDNWVADMTAAYKAAGLNDNAIKNLLAKNAHESGWGSSAQGDFNYGNITTGNSWTGRSVTGNDKDSNGNSISQDFRAYDSMVDYVSDEIQFLTNLYGFDQNDDFDTFIGKLQGNNSGNRSYAEDKEYAKKVRNVFNSI